MKYISVSVYLAGKYEDTILMSSALEMGPLWSWIWAVQKPNYLQGKCSTFISNFKFFLTTVFDFSWDNFNTHEKQQFKILEGKQGAIWSMQKWRITRFIAC